MSYSSYQGYGVPFQTPKVIKILIALTCIASISCTLLNNLFEFLLGVVGPESWFSLSWFGMNNFFLWQPISYLFIQNSFGQGITFSYLFILLFNMYLLWVIGSSVIDSIGTSSFLKLYLIVGAIAGLIALGAMRLTGQFTVLAGPTPSILALFTLWAMLHPERDVLLFFIFPVKVKWLAVGLLGVICLMNLSQLNSINFIFYTLSVFLGFLYAVLVWNLKSPFTFTSRFEKFLLNVKSKLTFGKKTKNSAQSPQNTKIFDFESGEPILDDDAFIDAMLSKISILGERSLTWKERQRMQSISDRKNKTQK